ncbi:PREDICTED: SPARC-related modular calcium-binding protein 2 [Myotis davidii]|uniref:SPARC-related modular calcium-binding protein 2 n=1 Tax=Myotis davidii TaxID=225400 RepID=UPI000767D019|nr:PREDICTED: SPARC-related modular calcium-binding protein 2 [Myotis davidii]
MGRVHTLLSFCDSAPNAGVENGRFLRPSKTGDSQECAATSPASQAASVSSGRSASLLLLQFLRVDQDKDKDCSLDCGGSPQKPVCASDGRTFLSRCEFQRAKCKDPQLEIAYRGNCKDVSRCVAERKYTQEQARKEFQQVFIPECSEDGTYSQVQCHSYTGYCWCVTPNGRPISGTAVAHKTPRCPGSINEKLPQREGTGKTDELKMTVPSFALLDIASRYPTLWTEQVKSRQNKTNKHSGTRAGAPGAVSSRWSVGGTCVLGYGVSTEPQSSDFGVFITCSTVSARFLRRCPANNSFRSSGTCVSATTGGRTRSPGEQVRALSMDEASGGREPCQESPGGGLLGVSCPDVVVKGLGSPGRPPFPPRRYEQPKCDNTARAHPTKARDLYKGRQLQGCPGAKKNEFLTSVLDALSTDMVHAVSDPSSPGRLSEPDPSHTLEERVVHWYFKLLDKNSSGDVGKKELKPFRRFLRKKSKPRKCVKKFVEYCDGNNDKALSLPELMGCLGVTKEERKAGSRKRHTPKGTAESTSHRQPRNRG